MRVVTCMDAGMRFGGREFPPGEGVVLEGYMADQVAQRLREAYGRRLYESSARCWERPLRIEAVRAGDTLVAWRGCALGDQLLWVGLLALVKARCPGLTIVNYTSAPELWAGVAGLPCEIRPDPIPFAEWAAAQWHLTGEGLFEDCQHPEQPDLWTVQLRAAGIDPRTVPASARRAVVPVTEADREQARAQMRGGDASGGRGALAPTDPPSRGAAADAGEYSRIAAAPVGRASTPESASRPQDPGAPGPGPSDRPIGGRGDAVAFPALPGSPAASAASCKSGSPRGCAPSAAGGIPTILWQLAASTPVRSYPPQETREALAGLLQEGCRVVVTGTKAQLAEYRPLPEGAVVLSGGVRVLFAAVTLADCVVCPDSVVGWVADAYGVPAVSLWGSFLPSDRLGTDTSHRPLIGAMAGCSPCRKHEKPWLPQGCPEHGGGYCRAIREIAPARIVRQVKEMI